MYIEDYSNEELFDAVEYRFGYKDDFEKKLIDLVKDHIESEPEDNTLPTMVDEWKRELFMKHYDKFTLEEFEEFLKSKKVVL
jgi:hypothetical protein